MSTLMWVPPDVPFEWWRTWPSRGRPAPPRAPWPPQLLAPWPSVGGEHLGSAWNRGATVCWCVKTPPGSPPVVAGWTSCGSCPNLTPGLKPWFKHILYLKPWLRTKVQKVPFQLSGCTKHTCGRFWGNIKTWLSDTLFWFLCRTRPSILAQYFIWTCNSSFTGAPAGLLKVSVSAN